MNFVCNFRIRTSYILSSYIYLKNSIKPRAIFKQHKNAGFSSGKIAIDSIYNLKKNVLLYSYEKTKMFKYLTVFGFSQLGLWVFYAGYLFVNLRDISKSEIKSEKVLTESTLWRRINLGDMKYRVISTILCLSIGLATAFITYALPKRIIKELTLCKGGTIASIVTYGPFGKTESFKIPLNKLSCAISREEAKSYIPIRIRNKWLFYLVDCKGIFHQPRLFDYSVGTINVKPY